MFVPREPREPGAAGSAGGPDGGRDADQQPVQEPGGTGQRDMGRLDASQPDADQPGPGHRPPGRSAADQPGAGAEQAGGEPDDDEPEVRQPAGESGAEQPDSHPGGVEPDSEPGVDKPGGEEPDSEPGGEELDSEPDGESEAGGLGSEGEPRVAPVSLPDGLADVPAGVWLCEALDGVDPELISGFDTVEVMGAAYRQANRQRAVFLRTLLETGLRAPDSGDRVVRVTTPGEFAAEEARAALVWSRRRAETALGLAFDVFDRLPGLGEAMLGGWLDEPRARAFTEWTSGLTDAQAGTVCDGLLPVAPNLMVGELITRIQRAACAIDPDWAQRRYQDTLATRRIVASRNEDGTANVEGRNLPVDRAAAACDRIDTLARAVKHAGAGNRPIDHIRVDLFLGSTDGTFEGMTDEQIITHVVNHPLVTDPNPNDTTSTSSAGSEGDDDGGGDTADDETEAEQGTDETGGDDTDDDGDGPDGDGLDGGGGPPAGGADGSGSPGEDTHDSDDDGTGAHETADAADSCDSAGAAGATSGTDAAATDAGTAGAAGRQARPAACGWAVRELRIELATLLGRNEHPGEIPGTGHVPAALARQLAAAMGSGQWRYVICSPLGRMISCGILASRPRPPDGGAGRRDLRRGGIVEIGVTTSQLHQLAATSINTHGRWAGVITELADHYNRHLADTDPEFDHIRPDEGTRAPNAGHGASAPNAGHGASAPNAGQGPSAPNAGQGTSAPNAGQGPSAPNAGQGTSAPNAGWGMSVSGGVHDPGSGHVAADGHPTGSDPPADGQTSDQRRRLPGAKLRREIQMRDRQCVHVACRMPATRTDLDHAHDYAAGGLTTASNMSAVCRWHHRLKHDGRWTVSKPEPAITLWGTPLGHTYLSVPPQVMPRLPDPQPRDSAGYDLLPDKTTRGCGCYGHCTCGPTMPANASDTRTRTGTGTGSAPKSGTEIAIEPAPDSDDSPLNIDDEPPY